MENYPYARNISRAEMTLRRTVTDAEFYLAQHVACAENAIQAAAQGKRYTARNWAETSRYALGRYHDNSVALNLRRRHAKT